MVEAIPSSIRAAAGLYLAAILLFVLGPLIVVCGVSFTAGDYVTFPRRGSACAGTRPSCHPRPIRAPR